MILATDDETSEKTLYDLLSSAFVLQTEVRKKTDELKLLKDKICEMAEVDEFNRNKKLVSKDLTAKIYFKEAIKWDQNILEKLRIDLGDNIFFKIFIWEYKPIRNNISDITYYFDEKLQKLFQSASKKQRRSPSIELIKASELN